MICNPCKNGDHKKCPSKLVAETNKKPTGLSPEAEAVQRSGLCPCRHRVAKDENVSLIDFARAHPLTNLPNGIMKL